MPTYIYTLDDTQDAGLTMARTAANAEGAARPVAKGNAAFVPYADNEAYLQARMNDVVNSYALEHIEAKLNEKRAAEKAEALANPAKMAELLAYTKE